MNVPAGSLSPPVNFSDDHVDGEDHPMPDVEAGDNTAKGLMDDLAFEQMLDSIPGFESADSPVQQASAKLQKVVDGQDIDLDDSHMLAGNKGDTFTAFQATTDATKIPKLVRKNSKLQDAHLSDRDFIAPPDGGPSSKKKLMGSVLPPLPWSADPTASATTSIGNAQDGQEQEVLKTMNVSTEGMRCQKTSEHMKFYANDHGEIDLSRNLMSADELIGSCKNAAVAGQDEGAKTAGAFMEAGSPEFEIMAVDQHSEAPATAGTQNKRKGRLQFEEPSSHSIDANGPTTTATPDEGQQRGEAGQEENAPAIQKGQTKPGSPTTLQSSMDCATIISAKIPPTIPPGQEAGPRGTRTEQKINPITQKPYSPSIAAHHNRIYRPDWCVDTSSPEGRSSIDMQTPAKPSSSTAPGTSSWEHNMRADDANQDTAMVDTDSDDEGDCGNFTIPNDPKTLGRSLEKLIVAILTAERDNGRASLTLKQIIDKIRKLSSYYAEQEVGGDAILHPWTRNVEDVLHQYDFPTEPFLDRNDGELHFAVPEGGEWFVLNKPSKGKGRPFKLMELPFELRLMVYTYVLRHPLPDKQGWAPNRDYTLNCKNLIHRQDRSPQRLTTIGPGGWELRTRPMPELLAITMASHEIQREALPVFYRTNTFYFESPKIMGRFYAGIPNRTEWMRSIILNFDPEQTGHECKRSIAQLFHTKLRELHLIVDEDALLTKHCVSHILGIPGVKFLAELTGLDRVTFKGNCKGLKKYLYHAEITRTKNQEEAKPDTDEDIDAVIERKKTEHRKEIKRAFKQHARDARRAATQHKRDIYRSDVQRRALERSARKQRRLDRIEAKREKNRRLRERERREIQREREEERDAKLERREAQKNASARKRQALENEKAQRREEREAARAAKQDKIAKTKEARRKEAQRKIKEQRQMVKQRLKGGAKGRKGVIASALQNDDTTDSDDDDTTEDESSDYESDSESDTAPPKRGPASKIVAGKSIARKTVARKVPVSNKRRAAEIDEDSTTEDETSSEEEGRRPPPKKQQKSYYGGSIKGVANNLQRGAGGPSKGMPKPKAPAVSPAQKLAAMRKTMDAKQGIVQKGCSGAQKAKPAAAVGKKKAETVMLSDGWDSDDNFD